jgi:hypothetical protein
LEIVMHHRNPVCTELDIQFHAIHANVKRPGESGERVFGSEPGCTPMANHMKFFCLPLIDGFMGLNHEYFP